MKCLFEISIVADMKIRAVFLIIFSLLLFVDLNGEWNRFSFFDQRPTITALIFRGEYDIPHNQSFKSTTIGGLSGIDYDPEGKIFYLISDDRSAINPVRFYTAKIVIANNRIDTVEFVSVQTLFQENGQPYPSIKQDHSLTVDPESIRYNPLNGQLIWTSEGERALKPDHNILSNPSIFIADANGKYAGTFPTPPNLVMSVSGNGPRQNGTLEGITFDDNFKTLYATLEEPRYEDGPRADVLTTLSWIRIYQYNTETKKNTAQYAYQLDPVSFPANPPTAFKVNGVSEILALGGNKLLTVERSYSTGRLSCSVKIFVADLSEADDISKAKSLKENPPLHPVQKKLLLNMDELNLYVDNIEGVTFGPLLPNGHSTLLFVSDNNFSPFEKMQFLLFEVIP